MKDAQIVLFEDQFLDDMSPVTLTRPAFAATCACFTLYEIASRASPNVRYIVREFLRKTAARRYPNGKVERGPALFLNASIVPDTRYMARIRELADESKPFILTSGRRVSVAFVPDGTPIPEALTAEGVTPWLLELKLPLHDEEGFKTFDFQFELIKHLEDLFPGNIEYRLRSGSYREVKPGVFAAKDVSIADTAVFKTRGGPVVLEEGVEIQDFAYLLGPVHVGAKTRIIERATLKECVCIGATCKIGGEIEASIIEDRTNKQHHGFLGHSYVGSWVNLGAGTSNSDLKNTYGEVRLESRRGKIDTGMQFLGAIIGDNAKSAINTSIFTGKIIGVSSMLYGFVGQNVASFVNFARSFGQITECPVDQAILIQKRMFERRGVSQTPEDVELLKSVFEATRSERLISDEPPAL